MTTKITISLVEELRQKLEAQPPVDASKRQITKAEAIQLMSKEIKTLQERGYSLEMIARLISENGMKISKATLSSSIYRSKQGDPEKKRATKKTVIRATSTRKSSIDRKKDNDSKFVDPKNSQSRSAAGFEVRPDSTDI